MVREAYTNRPNANFPTADQSIGFGWRFFKSNFIFLATVGALSAFVAFVISLVPLVLSNDPPWFIVVPTWLLSRLAIVLGTVASIRRGLDFWDERGEETSGSDIFEATSTAFRAATRRLLPWIGYNLVVAVGLFVVIFPLLVVLARIDSIGWGLFFGTLAVGIAAWLATRWVFVPIASADGPGDAITTSWEMTKEQFWAVFGTLVQLALVALLAWVPVLIVRWVFGSSWIWLAVRVVYAIGVQALYIGCVANMYRWLDKTVGRIHRLA